MVRGILMTGKYLTRVGQTGKFGFANSGYVLFTKRKTTEGARPACKRGSSDCFCKWSQALLCLVLEARVHLCYHAQVARMVKITLVYDKVTKQRTKKCVHISTACWFMYTSGCITGRGAAPAAKRMFWVFIKIFCVYVCWTVSWTNMSGGQGLQRKHGQTSKETNQQDRETLFLKPGVLNVRRRVRETGWLDAVRRHHGCVWHIWSSDRVKGLLLKGAYAGRHQGFDLQNTAPDLTHMNVGDPLEGGEQLVLFSCRV